MGVNLGGPPSVHESPAASPGAPDAGARVLAFARSASSSLPGSVREIPGDPVVAQRVGLAAGCSLLTVAVLGPAGVLDFNPRLCPTARVADLYGFILAALSILLEAAEFAPKLA